MSRLRMGMAGGGAGAFIGEIHRAAARLDGEIELVCGAFSSNPDRSRQAGAALELQPQRAYSTWREMLAAEAALPPETRMQFVAIVTPNDMHFRIAAKALELGFHVLSDKPATCTVAEVLELEAAVQRAGCCYALTHTYLGYPMVAEARARVLNQSLGRIIRVSVEYAQGWLATAVEKQGSPQAIWRTDPARAGLGGSVGDIGVHAFNLAEYVAGVRIKELCADLGKTLPERRLDDQAAAFLRFENGAMGTLGVSQVSTGEENDVTLGIYGERGGLVWSHRDQNSLRLLGLDGAQRILRAGNNVSELTPATRALCRTPAGHPEGFIEAFANLYRAFAADVRSAEAGRVACAASPAPISAAVRGMKFIEAMVRSSSAGQRWVALDRSWHPEVSA
jgi:predicted dehydrogenase